MADVKELAARAPAQYKADNLCVVRLCVGVGMLGQGFVALSAILNGSAYQCHNYCTIHRILTSIKTVFILRSIRKHIAFMQITSQKLHCSTFKISSIER